jgi:hypothetical protein
VAEPNPFAAVVPLPRDDTATVVSEPTAHGALHWAPHHDSGYTARMAAIARWVHDHRPDAFVVDVSVEVASFVRLLGVPLVTVTLPGERTDAPHLLVHRLADRIVAAWPHELATPEWLRPHADKTAYVGGISRFDGRTISAPAQRPTHTEVLVLGGAEGLGVAPAELRRAAAAVPDSTWTVLGGAEWVDDPWPLICAADVVVTHAGQNCIADVAAARRPAIVMPQQRPYAEQHATARVLQRHALAEVVAHWPEPRSWPTLIDRARSLDAQRWRRWCVEGAAARAAQSIDAVAEQHSPMVAR